MAQITTLGNLMQKQHVSRDAQNTQVTLRTSSTLTPQAKMCIERYKSCENFLTVFEPIKQYAYTKDLRRVFMGEAPALGTLSRAFGESTTIAWLEFQLIDLSEFSGCKDKLTPFQLDSIAQVIMATWGYYKVTELMLFFLQCKSGKYGKFYGAVDNMMITEALRKFDNERCQAIDQYVQEEQERQKRVQEEASNIAANEFREHVKRCCLSIKDYFEISNRYGLTPEEMEMVGWLFNMGYEPEQLAKERTEEAKRKAINAKRKADLDALIAELQRQRAALED